MKRVISASKRTDLPAFFLPWLIARMDEGFVDVPNPLYPSRIQRVSLQHDDVAWLVLWSKNFGPFQRFTGHFEGYNLYFQFTANPENPVFEPHVPSSDQAIEQAEFLATRYGGSRIAWRYDPIVTWYESGARRSTYDPSWFRRMCAALGPLGITRCFTSFCDAYPKVRRRIATIQPHLSLLEMPATTKQAWALELRNIAATYGITLYACSEPELEGILPTGACIDGTLLSALGATRVSCAASSDRHFRGRAACGCTRSIDIGDYRQHRCRYACLYCYARNQVDP
jgi:hypothetical protein